MEPAPIEVAIESAFFDLSTGACPECGFESLEEGSLITAIGGIVQDMLRFAVCGRCGYESL